VFEIKKSPAFSNNVPNKLPALSSVKLSIVELSLPPATGFLVLTIMVESLILFAGIPGSIVAAEVSRPSGPFIIVNIPVKLSITAISFL
jgi:hypothetical protein